MRRRFMEILELAAHLYELLRAMVVRRQSSRFFSSRHRSCLYGSQNHVFDNFLHDYHRFSTGSTTDVALMIAFDYFRSCSPQDGSSCYRWSYHSHGHTCIPPGAIVRTRKRYSAPFRIAVLTEDVSWKHICSTDCVVHYTAVCVQYIVLDF